MPVDPGNLLLLAYHDRVPVLGLPGCARSPKYNGLDPVLARLVADIEVTSGDVMAMGVGGLLKDYAGRPQPRAGRETSERAPARAPRVAALVLAAGQSRRMGTINKLLLELDGEPMLSRVLDQVTHARVDETLVVTGHQTDRVEPILADYPVRQVFNPDYAQGLSTSLRAGLAALPDDCDAVLVCLGDMPGVTRAQIDRLIEAFDPLEGRAICVPTCAGKRGNPILWDRCFVPEMAAASGDSGAKHLLGDHADQICEVEVGDRGVLLDVDTTGDVVG